MTPYDPGIPRSQAEPAPLWAKVTYGIFILFLAVIVTCVILDGLGVINFRD